MLLFSHPEQREGSEIKILHYVQNDNEVCKAALAQNDKAEKQCYNNVGGGFVKLLGCGPAMIHMLTCLHTWLLRGRVLIRTLPVYYLCGLRLANAVEKNYRA